MKSNARASIVEHLSQAANERLAREVRPGLEAAVQAVKRYQQSRFRRTYADLLQTERYGAAARFFLEELYGPADFSRRDAQFMRAVPAFVRLLPADVVHTIAALAQLHAVTESLDSEMGSHLVGVELDATAYLHAWQTTGRAPARAAQIALTAQVGAALDHHTRKPLLKYTLRAMRGASRAAGFGDLQHFLEAGFSAFQTMNGAGEFLNIVTERETNLADALFTAASPFDPFLIGQLPER